MLETKLYEGRIAWKEGTPSPSRPAHRAPPVAPCPALVSPAPHGQLGLIPAALWAATPQMHHAHSLPSFQGCSWLTPPPASAGKSMLYEEHFIQSDVWNITRHALAPPPLRFPGPSISPSPAPGQCSRPLPAPALCGDPPVTPSHLEASHSQHSTREARHSQRSADAAPLSRHREMLRTAHMPSQRATQRRRDVTLCFGHTDEKRRDNDDGQRCAYLGCCPHAHP